MGEFTAASFAMKFLLAFTLICLALAFLTTVLAESRFSRRLSKRGEAALVWSALLCCYGVCIGVTSALLSHFFHLREWSALMIAVPLAVPLLIFAAKVGEA
jgi:hypothetical protein